MTLPSPATGPINDRIVADRTYLCIAEVIKSGGFSLTDAVLKPSGHSDGIYIVGVGTQAPKKDKAAEVQKFPFRTEGLLPLLILLTLLPFLPLWTPAPPIVGQDWAQESWGKGEESQKGARRSRGTVMDLTISTPCSRHNPRYQETGTSRTATALQVV